MPAARRPIQRVDGSGVAGPGQRSPQDLQRDRRWGSRARRGPARTRDPGRLTMATGTPRPTVLTNAANAALMFPTLSPAQTARIASHGVIRPITRGEVLIEGGQ